VISERLNGGEMVDVATFEWLLHETAQSLTSPASSPAEQRAEAALALARASRSLHGLVATGVTAGDVVAVEITVTDPVGTCRTVNAYRQLPTPLELLIIGTARCRDGDTVTVVIHQAGGEPVARHDIWPFGLTRAEVMTHPVKNGAGLSAHASPSVRG
jgi:hypothetical protein